MPHKHTRREQDLSAFDLPPSQIARPLPVTKTARKNANQAKKGAKAAAAPTQGTKRKRGAAGDAGKADDAPRAFKRLMALASGKRVRSGLDDGNDRKSKKDKGKGKKDKKDKKDTKDGDAKEDAPVPTTTTATTTAASEVPTIRPGERLADFAARVDAALPLTGLIKSGKSGKDPLGLEKAFRTKKERKMHKLYAEWHEEERRLKEKQAEEQDEAEEREMELDESLGVKWRLDLQQASSSSKKKKAKGGSHNNMDAGGDDMWAEFNRKRMAATKTKAVRAGIHDVVEAPPELTKINSSKYFEKRKAAAAAAAATVTVTPTAKSRGAALADIPRAMAGLAEKQELLAARKEVLTSYRKRAEERRHQATSDE